MGLERLVFFSAAVYAIAITLSALDLRLPAEGPLSDAGLALWSKYLSYGISFLAVAVLW